MWLWDWWVPSALFPLFLNPGRFLKWPVSGLGFLGLPLGLRIWAPKNAGLFFLFAASPPPSSSGLLLWGVSYGIWVEQKNKKKQKTHNLRP